MADAPGGVEVGRVSIRVVPDTSKFRRELKRQLNDIAKTVVMKIQVELDDKFVKAKLKKLNEEVKDKTAKIDVDVDGDGAVRETRRIRQIVQKMVGAIQMTVGVNIAASVARIRADMAIINKLVQGYNIRIPIEVVGISKWLAILTAVSGLLLSMPHLIGLIGGAFNYVAGAIAILPALLAGVVATIATVAVGMNGFMDAMSKAGDPEKFEEALEKLTPSAQKAARALATMRQPLKDIRESVQEELFKGMDKSLILLNKLLPPIKTGLTGVAGGVRDMVKAWIQMATTKKSVEDTGIILKNVKDGFKEARPAAANFGKAMKDATVVGSTFLPRMGRAVSDVTGRFAKWAEEARESGKLEDMINNFIDKTKQLGRIIGDVVAGFRNIFNSVRTGEDFLDIIERISQGFREWSELDSTTSALQSLGRVLRVIIDAGTELFGQVFKSAGQVFKDLEPFLITFAQTFATVLADAIRAITPVLQSMARWLSENKKIMVPLLLVVISFVTAFKLLVTAAKGVKAVKDSFVALKTGASIIGSVADGIAGSAKKVGAALLESANDAARWVSTTTSKWREAAAQAVVNAAEVSKAWVKKTATTVKETAVKWAGAVADWAKSWGKASKAAVVNAVKVSATWIAETAKSAAAATRTIVAATIAWIANWVRMAAAATANAVRMAAAWLIAMGPVALVIAAIVGLVALIILNWDKIKAATKAVWDWIWGHIVRIGQEISDSFQSVVNFIRKIWDECWRVVSDIITTAGEVISSIVDGIKSVFRGIGDIVQDVIGFFTEIKDGIVNKVQEALDWLGDLGQKILDAIGDLGRLLWDTGRNLVKGLWDGWNSYFDDFKQAVIDDGNTLIDNINGLFGVFSPSRVFRQIGEYLGQGLIIGMESQRTGIFRAGDEMANAVMTGFGKPDIAIDLLTPVENAIPAALAAIQDFGGQAASAASSEWNASLTGDDVEPLEDRVLAALASGLTIEMDGEKVTKKINITNVKNARRR